MDARSFTRVALAAALSAVVVAVPATSRAGGGRPGGAVFRAGGGVHGVPGGIHGATMGAPRVGGFHGLPPVAGVIHEHAGMRPFFSAYGHTATALRPAGFARARFGGYGHIGTGLRSFGGARNRDARFARGLAFRERLRFVAARSRFGYGGGVGGYGGDADAGTYGGTGTYGASGTYGNEVPYGTAGTYGGAYASEEPLAARFAEPPLAPSPGAPYSPEDRYAYAASERVGPGPRIITVHHDPRQDCGCGPRVQPIVYRYGVGTAY